MDKELAKNLFILFLMFGGVLLALSLIIAKVTP